MNTLLLTVMCDSLGVKVCETAIKLMNEAGTNPADVAIAGTICDALVKIVTLCVGGFLLWKLIDHVAKSIEDRRKREWTVEDIERKQKSDLQNRFLDFQKELAFPYYKKKDESYEKKNYEQEESTKHLKTLALLAEIKLQKESHEDQEETKPVAEI